MPDLPPALVEKAAKAAWDDVGAPMPWADMDPAGRELFIRRTAAALSTFLAALPDDEEMVERVAREHYASRPGWSYTQNRTLSWDEIRADERAWFLQTAGRLLRSLSTAIPKEEG